MKSVMKFLKGFTLDFSRGKKIKHLSIKRHDVFTKILLKKFSLKNKSMTKFVHVFS